MASIKLPLNRLSLQGIGQRLWLDQDEKMRVVDNMRDHGGSFVQALAEVIARADRKNLLKIAELWVDYILEYADEKWLSVSKPKHA